MPGVVLGSLGFNDFCKRRASDRSKKIVAGVNNGLACGPQQPGIITQVLNGSWTDDYGQQFYPQVEAGYDQLNGTVNINNTFIINELTQNRPLLYANTHHCMVIVEADYFETPMGPNVRGYVLFAGRGSRCVGGGAHGEWRLNVAEAEKRGTRGITK
jgi:hypothetical protein